MGQVIAAKATGVAFSNTSLVQCDKTHLAAFNNVDASKTVSPFVTVTFSKNMFSLEHLVSTPNTGMYNDHLLATYTVYTVTFDDSG